MQWIRDYQPQPARIRLFRLALMITLGGNISLLVAKGIVAYTSGSVALYSDTANSASDVLYSLLMILGLGVALRPPDLSHPQGHSRFEPLVGLVVAVSMSFAGYEAGRTSLVRFISGGQAVEPGLPSLVLVASALLKAGMSVAILRISRAASSPALNATARDNLADMLTSLAAFIGILGSKSIHPITDPLAGLFVAIWIFRSAYRAGKENLDYLTGAGADQGLREKIVSIAASVPGVTGVHHIMTEYTGPKLVIDMHVNVNGEISLNDAHSIEDKVVTSLQNIPEVDRAYVHVEPHGWQDE